jgi:hypothetical protein
MPTRLTRKWLNQQLRDLGVTGDAVAATLRAAGIKGRRIDAQDCPVARYLRGNAASLLPGPATITVIAGTDTVVITVDGAGAGRGHAVAAPTPGPVEDFMDRFDDGGYADLAEAC